MRRKWYTPKSLGDAEVSAIQRAGGAPPSVRGRCAAAGAASETTAITARMTALGTLAAPRAKSKRTGKRLAFLVVLGLGLHAEPLAVHGDGVLCADYALPLHFERRSPCGRQLRILAVNAQLELAKL